MKICVLVKEVPDAAVQKRIDPSTGRMDRSGEKNLNPYDTHAIEAAMQLKEGGAVQVDEIVAVTMGPESRRARAAQGRLARRRPLGAPDRRRARRLRRRRDRLRAGAGARAREPRPRPARPAVRRRRVLHDRRRRGRPPADAVADPGHQASTSTASALRCERQAEYGYDTVEVALPAVISVGDAINEPRYPSLKAIMGAKKKPLDTLAAGDVEHRRRRRSAATARSVDCGDFQAPPAKAAGTDHRGRGHQRDGREDRRLARREEADLDGRHPGLRAPLRGRVQQELARRRLRGRRAGRRDRRRGHAVVVGEGVADDLAALARRATAPTKVFRAEGPEGLAQPVVDVMAAGHGRRRPRLRAVRRRPARLRDRRRPGRAPRTPA